MDKLNLFIFFSFLFFFHQYSKPYDASLKGNVRDEMKGNSKELEKKNVDDAKWDSELSINNPDEHERNYK